MSTYIAVRTADKVPVSRGGQGPFFNLDMTLAEANSWLAGFTNSGPYEMLDVVTGADPAFDSRYQELVMPRTFDHRGRLVNGTYQDPNWVIQRVVQNLTLQQTKENVLSLLERDYQLRLAQGFTAGQLSLQFSDQQLAILISRMHAFEQAVANGQMTAAGPMPIEDRNGLIVSVNLATLQTQVGAYFTELNGINTIRANAIIAINAAGTLQQLAQVSWNFP